MKTLRFVAIFIIAAPSFAQNMTYSKAEGTRFHELNLAMGAAKTYSSEPYFRAVIDSINHFLVKYPNSVYKTGLLHYKFDLTTTISSDVSSIGTLADTLLYYDSMASTKLWVAEILIQRNLDAIRGVKLIREAFPFLTVVNHRYRAFILLAKYDMACGNILAARENLQSAIHTDSTRYDAWFSYLALLRAQEDLSGACSVEREIERLDHENLLHYGEESTKSPNLFKNMSSYKFTDMKSRDVVLASLHNKVCVMNFFAFTCGVCVAELPVLQKLGQEFPDVIFLYVNLSGPLGGTPAEAKEKFLTRPEYHFLKTQKILFPDHDIGEALGISAVPRTLLIDKRGVVRFDYLGYVRNSGKLLKTSLQQLLKEK